MLGNSQFGFSFEGLATTKPAPAPGTADPSGPILFKAPCKAIFLSEETKEFRSRAASSAGTAKVWAIRSKTSPTLERKARMLEEAQNDTMDEKTAVK